MPTPRPFRLAALASLLAALVLGCGKRDREDAAAPTDPEPAAPVRPAPQPAPPPPKAPEPKPDPTAPPPEKGEPPITFLKQAAVPTITANTPFTANLKHAPAATVDEKAGRVLLPTTGSGGAGLIRTLPDGRLLVRYENKLVTLDSTRGGVVDEFALGNVLDVSSFAVSRDGLRAAAAFRDTKGIHHVGGYDLAGRKELWRMRTSTGVSHDLVTLSPDGRRGYVSPAFPSGYKPKSERIVFEPDTGKPLKRVTDERSPVLVAYPDNAHMLTASNGGMSVWDESFKLVGVLVRFDDKRRAGWTYRSVAVSPSGRLVAWCGTEQMVVASTETGEVRHYVALAAEPGWPVFSSDDRWLLLGHMQHDPGNTLHLLDLKTGREALRIVTSDKFLRLPEAAFTADNTAVAALIGGAVYRFPLPPAK